jgi:hypothetical protein
LAAKAAVEMGEVTLIAVPSPKPPIEENASEACRSGACLKDPDIAGRLQSAMKDLLAE